MKKILALLLSLVGFACISEAQTVTYKTIKDVPYLPDTVTDKYRVERCKLDFYYPENIADYPVMVWFHGGGLESGSKYIPDLLKEKGFGVVAVNYRLYPKSKFPAYIDDAACAVSWVVKNIRKYGSKPENIFVSGHSAGGYLSLILAMDKHYLAAYGVDADSLAAYLPVSGQTVTHFTIRKERGLPDGIPVVDDCAPIFHARKNTAPLILITGDRHLEMANRWEENAWFESVMRNIGNQRVSLYELQGFDHITVLNPALLLIADYLKKNGNGKSR